MDLFSALDKDIVRALCDKAYERRKRAGLEVERVAREALRASDPPSTVNPIIAQLSYYASSPESFIHVRNGGLHGLASVAIGLASYSCEDLSPYLQLIIPHVLAGLRDGDGMVRYFALESMYNICKVAKGEVLGWFNDLFDLMSRLIADTDQNIRNGIELLDRLLKDIVTERAANYTIEMYEPASGGGPSDDGPGGPLLNTLPEGERQDLSEQERAVWGRPMISRNADGTERNDGLGVDALEKAERQRQETSEYQFGENGDQPGSAGGSGGGLGKSMVASGSSTSLHSQVAAQGKLSQSSGEQNGLSSATALLRKQQRGRANSNVGAKDGRVWSPSISPALGAYDEKQGEITPVPTRPSSPPQLVSGQSPTKGMEITIQSEGNKRFVRKPTFPNFSFDQFIPLLSERIFVISPLVRSFLINWIAVLDSVPDISIISYLQDFMLGLLKYLAGDSTQEVHEETEELMGLFLRELEREAEWRKGREEKKKGRRKAKKITKRSKSAGGIAHDEIANGDLDTDEEDNIEEKKVVDDGRLSADEDEEDGLGEWAPGIGRKINHAGILDVLLQGMDIFEDEDVQCTVFRWILTLLHVAEDVTLSFIPRLIPYVLRSLSHPLPSIRSIANELDIGLRTVINNLPVPPPSPKTRSRPGSSQSSLPLKRPPSVEPNPPSPSTTAAPGSKVSTRTTSPTAASVPFPSMPASATSGPTRRVTRGLPQSKPASTPADRSAESVVDSGAPSLPNIPEGRRSGDIAREREKEKESKESASRDRKESETQNYKYDERLDWDSTIHQLHMLFLEDQRTRVAAMDWLSLLHRKAPNKITPSGSVFPSLLACLSDPSDEVIRVDLRLVSQILSFSDDESLRQFMINLLKLFGSSRDLLERRGTLIVRLLCEYLDTETVYRWMAELLEHDVAQDLEFSSTMVQNLTTLLLTTPQMGDFRRKLKNLDTREGQILFTILYRSWSHNAVATFSLCLLAQAYEQAFNLLSIFGELEVSVNLLIQIDKFVSLLESPVFTSLRLQLLEPEKYPYLFKALYGLLMLLPQSSAFTMLRNRLNSVSALGFLHVVPRHPPPQTSRSSTTGTRREDQAPGPQSQIRWNELLQHFRAVQLRHERARGGSMAFELADSLDPQSLAAASAGAGGMPGFGHPPGGGAGIGLGPAPNSGGGMGDSMNSPMRGGSGRKRISGRETPTGGKRTPEPASAGGGGMTGFIRGAIGGGKAVVAPVGPGQGGGSPSGSGVGGTGRKRFPSLRRG